MKNFKLVLSFLALLTLLSSEGLAKTVKWQLATTWGKNAPPVSDAAKEMARLVKEMSNGRFIIKVHSSNRHKSPLGIFEFVKGGQFEMGHSASYYWKGKVPETMYFTTLPFGMTAMEQYSWFYHGGGNELMQKVYNKHGMYSFIGGNTGVQMGGWFRKEINKIEDLKGLKMRIPGFAGEVMAKVGAVPTNIPPGELFTSLQLGTIDALEWISPSMDLSMGFHKIAPYYYTGWHEPGSEMQFLINQKKFDALDEDLKAILLTAMEKASFSTYIKATHMSGVNWEKMRSEFPNIKVKTFPKPVLKRLHQETENLLKEYSNKSPLAKEIINSRRDYLKKVRAWTEIGESVYIETTKDLQ